jgi:hypothetical protein
MAQLERDLHRAVGDYLNACLMPPAFWTTFPADGATRRGRIGLVRGVPDILIIYQGRAYWLELKGPRGKLSDNQLGTIGKIRDAGSCVASDVRTLEKAVSVLEQWGIPTRGRLVS